MSAPGCATPRQVTVQPRSCLSSNNMLRLVLMIFTESQRVWIEVYVHINLIPRRLPDQCTYTHATLCNPLQPNRLPRCSQRGSTFAPRAALSEIDAVLASQSPCLAGVFWSWPAISAPAATAAAPALPVPRCRTAWESSWLLRPSESSTDDAAPLSALAAPPGFCKQKPNTISTCCSPP